jgi:hypothetical protein
MWACVAPAFVALTTVTTTTSQLLPPFPFARTECWRTKRCPRGGAFAPGRAKNRVTD